MCGVFWTPPVRVHAQFSRESYRKCVRHIRNPRSDRWGVGVCRGVLAIILRAKAPPRTPRRRPRPDADVEGPLKGAPWSAGKRSSERERRLFRWETVKVASYLEVPEVREESVLVFTPSERYVFFINGLCVPM